jgi:hypothetical protein
MHLVVDISCCRINSINGSLKSCICILRVEVPDGSYTLVPEDVNEGAGGCVHYVTVEKDPGQSPDDCLTACTNEGKPRFYHQPMFYLNYATIFVILCAFMFRN